MAGRIFIKKENWEDLGLRLPVITCPGCGQSLLGTSSHGITKDGEVNNSVVCPSCVFHEYVTLEGWTGGEIPKLVNHLIDGNLYSKKPFEGYTHRFVLQLAYEEPGIGSDIIRSFNIYSNCGDHKQLRDFIRGKITKKVKKSWVKDIYSREEDDYLNELIKDF